MSQSSIKLRLWAYADMHITFDFSFEQSLPMECVSRSLTEPSVKMHVMSGTEERPFGWGVAGLWPGAAEGNNRGARAAVTY